MIRTITTAATIAAAVLAVAGCAAEEPEVADDPTRGENTPTVTATPVAPDDIETEAAESPAVEEEPGGGIAAFGEAVAWPEQGLEVTVSPPQPYEPGEFAVGHDQAAAIAFEIRAVNTGSEPYDPSLFFTSVQSANVEAVPIFDDQIPLPPSTTVLPGREVVWQQAWSVTDPADLVMDVDPAFVDIFDYATATYATS